MTVGGGAEANANYLVTALEFQGLATALMRPQNGMFRHMYRASDASCNSLLSEQ